MNESILTSIKKLLGIEESYEHFDQDIIMHINSVFTILKQLGVGPDEGFSIQDKTSVWGDFIGNGTTDLNSVKTYVYMKVRQIFDPPVSSYVMDSMNSIINELEWRINVTVDKPE